MVHGVRAPGPPRLRRTGIRPRCDRRARASAAPAARRRRRAGTRPDPIAPASGCSRPSTGRCPAAPVSRAAASSRSAPGCRLTAPDASASASPTSARARERGIGSVSGSSPAIVATSGKTCVSALGSGLGGRPDAPVQRGQPPRQPTGGRDRHLLAEHGPQRDLVAVDRADRAPPRAGRRASGPMTGSDGQEAGDRQRVRVQVEQAPAALHRGGDIAQVSQRERALHPVLAGNDPQPSHPGSVRKTDCSCVFGRGDHLDPGHRPRRRGNRRSGPGRSAAGTAAAGTAPRTARPRRSRRSAAVTPSRGPFPQHARRRVVDLEHRRVELADGGEPGRERDVAHRQHGRLDQNPGRPRPLRAGQRQRPRADLGREHPADLARRVAEPGRQPGHPVPVHDPVRDQPHRPRGHVRPDVPVGRAGRGVRPAPLAGSGTRPAAPPPPSGRTSRSPAWA